MERHLVQRLANQMSRGDLILFTGAGFSLSAKSLSGVNLPSVAELSKILWPLAFPGEPFDNSSSLGDIYECAIRHAGNRVRQALNDHLRVDSSQIPECYKIWFSIPWTRIYTLNVDDLDEAVQLAFQLRRRIKTVSAIRDSVPGSTSDLLSIHLNGRINDYPEITFSQRQYGERAARNDPWYHHLVTDLSSHPVLFVGTLLEEPLLWQNIELRKGKGVNTRELRPGSYLVAPKISAARRTILQDFNVQLIEMTQEEFASQILSQMGEERQLGMTALSAKETASQESKVLERVADLRSRPTPSTGEFLLGQEPSWEDITSGTAVHREFEHELFDNIQDSQAKVVLITGTAGSGKSTTLMRLALAYDAEGKNVLWMDVDTDLYLWQIKKTVKEARAHVLMIDDADTLATSTGSFLADLAEENPNLLIIAGMRSTRFEKLQIEDYLKDTKHFVYTIPHLGDSDINLLLDALTKANRLGALRELNRQKQIAIFREQAGRQLLVAMIQATSGERFEEKIDRECRELSSAQSLIYATAAIATSLRSYVTKDEILLAINDSSNEALNLIDGLTRQRLLINDQNQIRLRHRVVADRSIDYYRLEGQLGEPLEGLLWAIATKVHPGTSRNSREFKFLRRLINHDFMINLASDPTAPRKAYSLVEDILQWNYHYYLQRGSYEVEIGNIDLAKNFLDQALAMAPDDYMVQTEWAYMTLKRAAMNAASASSKEQAEDAFTELEDAISRRGKNDSYPYHVLGSQGLSWVRRAIISSDEKARLLSRLLQIVKEGLDCHPRAKDLAQLVTDINREYLMMTVPSEIPTSSP